uniref:Zinc finger hit domain-containing protein 2 n=1 Tax=Triatoma infestans TaxID=30076 RepID=A0A170TYI1_TRIIF
MLMGTMMLDQIMKQYVLRFASPYHLCPV